MNEKKSLVITRDSSEATLFTLREANASIGTGRRSHFYNVIEADVVPMSVEVATPHPKESYKASELDIFETPPLFDGLNNN